MPSYKELEARVDGLEARVEALEVGPVEAVWVEPLPAEYERVIRDILNASIETLVRSRGQGAFVHAKRLIDRYYPGCGLGPEDFSGDKVTATPDLFSGVKDGGEL